MTGAEAAKPGSSRPWIILGLMLAAAAATLFGAGLQLEQPWRATPRLAAFAGNVTIDGRPARADTRLPRGAKLAISGEGTGSAMLRYEDGTRVSLSGRGELSAAGISGGVRALRLEHGQLRVVGGDGDASAAIEIASPLGRVRAAGATFELTVSAPATGAAAGTPRSLTLAVARGRTELTAAGRAERADAVQTVRAGLRARVIEDLGRVESIEPMLSAEWERLTVPATIPRFTDSKLPAGEVPAGVWVPRWPGRNGPGPGSRLRARMSYRPDLSAGALEPTRDNPALWCYDAAADRWRDASAAGARPLADSTHPEAVPDVRGLVEVARCLDSRRGRVLLLAAPAPGDPPGTPAALWSYSTTSREWRKTETPSGPATRMRGSMAYSAKADAVLFFGGRGSEGETWVLRPATERWERVEPQASPPPRAGGALYYDPAADLFVLFGGAGLDAPRSDVWVFRMAN